jgi:predicted secreted hydrolase
VLWYNLGKLESLMYMHIHLLRRDWVKGACHLFYREEKEDHVRRIMVFLGVAIVLAGCAHNKSVYIPYNDNGHKDAIYEWAPHDDGGEWWYLTGYVSDQDNKLYLYQITIFHGYKVGTLLEGYALNLSFTDCSTGQHVFSEEIKFRSDKVYADSRCAVFKDSLMCLDNQQIKIVGKSDKLRLDLECTPTKDAVWHGKDGIIIMGYPEKPKERSYYYSYTNITTKGAIEFKDENDNWIKIDGSGKAWFDRQWGKFSELGWEWFSFRFFDDEEIMLFPFPRTGIKEGTYIDNKGNAISFDNFTYNVKKFRMFNGKKIGLGWNVTVPFKEKEYEVVPIVEDQYNPSKLQEYWEGICKVFNSRGELVGYCIIETPGSAY